MMNTGPEHAAREEEEAVGRIVRNGAGGALTLAAVATALVVAMWLAFYLLVFVPRATVP